MACPANTGGVSVGWSARRSRDCPALALATAEPARAAAFAWFRRLLSLQGRRFPDEARCLPTSGAGWRGHCGDVFALLGRFDHGTASRNSVWLACRPLCRRSKSAVLAPPLPRPRPAARRAARNLARWQPGSGAVPACACAPKAQWQRGRRRRSHRRGESSSRRRPAATGERREPAEPAAALVRRGHRADALRHGNLTVSRHGCRLGPCRLARQHQLPGRAPGRGEGAARGVWRSFADRPAHVRAQPRWPMDILISGSLQDRQGV